MEKLRKNALETKGTQEMTLIYKEMKSLVGKVKLVANDQALVAVLWENDAATRVKLPAMSKTSKHPILDKTESQLEEYFSGARTKFDLPLNPLGTEFQRKVWEGLSKIPFGKTESYGALAKSIGAPQSSRAVGAANGRNPISIVIPCHRVIGASGKLTGFAGGLKTKRTLLRLENPHLLI